MTATLHHDPAPDPIIHLTRIALIGRVCRFAEDFAVHTGYFLRWEGNEVFKSAKKREEKNGRGVIYHIGHKAVVVLG